MRERYYHTSPTPIAQIHDLGLFGSFLFFSARPYRMSEASAVVYTVEVDEGEIVEAWRLFHLAGGGELDALVREFSARFEVDEDTAEDVISERAQLDGADAEASWECQHFTARAARILGFRGVRVQDEQGHSVMLDMLGREGELVRIGEGA